MLGKAFHLHALHVPWPQTQHIAINWPCCRALRQWRPSVPLGHSALTQCQMSARLALKEEADPTGLYPV